MGGETSLRTRENKQPTATGTLVLLLVDAVRSGAAVEAVLEAPGSLPGTKDEALGLNENGLALGLSFDNVFLSGSAAGSAGWAAADAVADGAAAANAGAPLDGAASAGPPLCCCFQS